MPTTGLFRLMDPADPKKLASPKVKISPSPSPFSAGRTRSYVPLGRMVYVNGRSSVLLRRENPPPLLRSVGPSNPNTGGAPLKVSLSASAFGEPGRTEYRQPG